MQALYQMPMQHRRIVAKARERFEYGNITACAPPVQAGVSELPVPVCAKTGYGDSHLGFILSLYCRIAQAASRIELHFWHRIA
jgi:hypothetical protein